MCFTLTYIHSFYTWRKVHIQTHAHAHARECCLLTKQHYTDGVTIFQGPMTISMHVRMHAFDHQKVGNP